MRCHWRSCVGAMGKRRTLGQRWEAPLGAPSRLDLLFDVLADEPLHQRSGLTSGDAHHGLACSRAVVDVHQVHDDCRHWNRVQGDVSSTNRKTCQHYSH